MKLWVYRRKRNRSGRPQTIVHVMDGKRTIARAATTSDSPVQLMIACSTAIERAKAKGYTVS